MKKPRTEAQKRADFRKTFPKKVNQRRLELIMKEHAGCPPEKRNWKFDEHPGWKEECDARRHANLTDAERAELKECERILDEWEKPLWEERFAYLDAKWSELAKGLATQDGVFDEVKYKEWLEKFEIDPE